MENKNKKVPFWEIMKTLGIFLIAFVVIVFVAKKIDSLFVHTEDQTNSRQQVSCDPTNLAYTSFLTEKPNQSVSLIPYHENMSAKDGQFVNSTVIITKIETKDSKVACGYLYAKAGTEKNGALQSWENLYINPNNFGGHIDPKSAIWTNDGNKYSEYLFLLNQIQYRRSLNNRTLLTADWASLLNVSPSVDFQIGLNTNDSTGFVDQLSIAYKCWDPKTGEENTGCKLTVTH